MTQQEKEAFLLELMDSFTEEERDIFAQAYAVFDSVGIGAMDKPEGTIITDSYYSDYTNPVITKDTLDAYNSIIGAAAAEEAP